MVCRRGPERGRGLAAPTTKTSASVNIDIMSSTGLLEDSQFKWTVLVVRKDPYVRLTQAEADQVRLLVSAGPGPTQLPKPKE